MFYIHPASGFVIGVGLIALILLTMLNSYHWGLIRTGETTVEQV